MMGAMVPGVVVAADDEAVCVVEDAGEVGTAGGVQEVVRAAIFARVFGPTEP
jgi:hypothetical protein